MINLDQFQSSESVYVRFSEDNVKIIENESELPFREASHQWFLRSVSAPTVLMEYHNGQCFARADGENWMYPAYARARNADLTWKALEPRGGYCDHTIYLPEKAEVSA